MVVDPTVNGTGAEAEPEFTADPATDNVAPISLVAGVTVIEATP
jgi:hypothetical protein